jgi:RimJ/RimL family protein N-acetyltransferase
MGHIIGKRIMLREYRREDLEAIRKWRNNAEITRFLSHIFLPPQTDPITEEFLERVLSGRHNDYNFIIADRETQAYIGQIDLFNLQSINRTAELGIVIGDPGRLCQGIGEEAIGLLLEFAFTQANLQRIDLWVNENNARALRCYEKCGFVREGVRRHCHFSDGEYIDLILMGALRDEWRLDGKRSGPLE